MARFRPEALKITDDPCFCEYWVINQSKDIRPCAILLFTPEQYRVLGMLEEDIYARDDLVLKEPKVCHWDNWKEKYFEFRKYHKLN